MGHKDIYRDGKRLVSVTELTGIIGKPFLDKWREGLCCPEQGQCGFVRSKQIAEEASTLGTEAHKYVENWFKSLPLTHNEWGVRLVDKLTEMRIQKHLIEPETTLIDYPSGLAGSPDFIGTDGTDIFIGDLKIKNSLDALTGMQGMGYRYLMKRKYGEDIKKMLILWAQKKTVKQTVKPVIIDLDQWVRPWHALVELWNVLNPSRKVVVHE